MIEVTYYCDRCGNKYAIGRVEGEKSPWGVYKVDGVGEHLNVMLCKPCVNELTKWLSREIGG